MALCSESGVPHKGWSLVDVIDLRDDGHFFGDYENCQFCGKEQIRFVHLLKHDAYPSEMRVGCICSCHLTQDYVTPKVRERAARNRAARKEKFLTRKWKTTVLGGETVKLKGYQVTVGQLPNGLYRVWIRYEYWVRAKEGKNLYPTAEAAKLRAFDAVHEIIEKDRKRGL